MSKKAQAMVFRALAVSLVWLLLPTMAQGQDGFSDLTREWDQACADGDMEMCHSAGFMYRSGLGAQDYERAAALLQRACEGGVAAGCGNLGDMHYLGQGVEQEYSRAAALYRQACDGGFSLGCGRLAMMYARGEGVTQDHVRSVRLYEHACQGGLSDGCAAAGVMYSLGENVSQDYARAFTLSRRACELGSWGGCGVLAGMYSQGEGVIQDFVRAHALYNMVTAQGREDARELRDMTARRMTPQQIAEAQALARRCMEDGMEHCL